MAGAMRTGSPVGASPASPQQPLSKRDKRRKNILEKLGEMVAIFGKDQNLHYRAQLQAIQVDMTLLLRADPYENSPLNDDSQHIEELIDQLTAGNTFGGKAAREDFLALAGRRYYEYCQEINRAQERRDADLTMLKNNYESAISELERLNNYKIQVAQREHLELSSTIRQRLINTVTKKRDRLMREKEQLDIADSNSLLLHPSHYTVNAPSSPGGIHSNRKTRHTRNRIGDMEEPILERGRKRKAGDEDGNDSPLPGFRPLTQDGTGNGSPFQEQKAKAIRSQQESGAYSVESIFTEKELAHATTAAQFATHNFFYQQSNGEPNGIVAQAKPVTMEGVEGNTDALSALADTAEAVDQAAVPNGSAPEAVGMERQVSNYATRGATKANPLSFLADNALGIASTEAIVNPFQPMMIPITKTDKGAPTPPGASNRDVQLDLSLMTEGDDATVSSATVARLPAEDSTAQNGRISIAEARKLLLEQACKESTASQPFRIPLTDLGPAMIKDGVNRSAAIGFADPASIPSNIRDGTASNAAAAAAGYSNLAGMFGAAGVPMSRTTSMGGSEIGASDVGGVAMRRTRSRAV